MRERFVSWDSTYSPALLRFMRELKQHPTNNEPQNSMNWAQVTQKKQQQAQVYVSTIYFYIYAYISKF